MSHLRIALLEPFYADSHKEWADKLAKYSKHQFTLFTLPGKFWKWRMHGAALTLSHQVNASPETFDRFLVTDMLDVATFKALLEERHRSTPIYLYMHENQLTYPWSPSDMDPTMNRDRHYAWINYTSCLVADRVFFNSKYHLQSFINALPDFLKAFPDYKELPTIERIREKSSVLFLGMDFSEQKISSPSNAPVILWNHRWEYDKNPDLFFEGLYQLKALDLPFQLIVCGRSYPDEPSIFAQAQQDFKEKCIHWGYANSKEDYYKLLQKADLLPVTSHQDFFGISVVEGIYHGLSPLLPKRLAYPDYISPDTFASHYYENDQAFVETLVRIVREWPSSYANLSHEVEAFNWTNCIEPYDQTLITR